VPEANFLKVKPLLRLSRKRVALRHEIRWLAPVFVHPGHLDRLEDFFARAFGLVLEIG
jgi:hypothetical protein